MKKELKRIIIAAVSRNGFIGNRNSIPWNSKEEQKSFRKITLGHPVIMGRNTFSSLPKILDKRLNIVISRKPDLRNNKKPIICFDSLHKAYQFLRLNNHKKVYICGGGRIYRNSIKHADEMIISHMKFNSRGDIRFPRINPKMWNIVKEKEFKDFVIRYYSRKV